MHLYIPEVSFTSYFSNPRILAVKARCTEGAPKQNALVIYDVPSVVFFRFALCAYAPDAEDSTHGLQRKALCFFLALFIFCFFQDLSRIPETGFILVFPFIRFRRFARAWESKKKKKKSRIFLRSPFCFLRIVRPLS